MKHTYTLYLFLLIAVVSFSVWAHAVAAAAFIVSLCGALLEWPYARAEVHQVMIGKLLDEQSRIDKAEALRRVK